MQSLETSDGGYLLIDLGIILHRAAPERIEPGVNTEIHLRQIGVVPHNIDLAHLRQSWSLSAKQIFRDRGAGHNLRLPALRALSGKMVGEIAPTRPATPTKPVILSEAKNLFNDEESDN